MQISIPGCATDQCRLDDFIELNKDILIYDFEAECRMSQSNSDQASGAIDSTYTLTNFTFDYTYTLESAEKLHQLREINSVLSSGQIRRIEESIKVDVHVRQLAIEKN